MVDHVTFKKTMQTPLFTLATKEDFHSERPWSGRRQSASFYLEL